MKNVLLFLLLIGTYSTINGQDILLLKTSGKVVIGDTSQIATPGNYNLYVQNGILTERVKVAIKTTSEWSDDAFDKTPTLAQVHESIEQNRHLVEMPSAESLVKDGYELKSMDAKLLQQIEWLWQHVIELEKQNVALQKQLSNQTTKD